MAGHLPGGKPGTVARWLKRREIAQAIRLPKKRATDMDRR
jgi:hypothetical protein